MEDCSSLPRTTCMHPYCSPLLLLPPLKLSFCLQAAYEGSNRWLCQAGGLGVTTKSVSDDNIVGFSKYCPVTPIKLSPTSRTEENCFRASQ